MHRWGAREVMKNFVVVGAVSVAALSLAACHIPGMKPKAPSGQVAATVNGHEITQLDLQTEMAGTNATDPKVRKALEQRALETIITREIVADAARKQKLDKSPEFAIQQKRATDNLLAQMLEQKLVAAVPTPSDDEVQKYVTDHPEMFTQRKVYQLDTIRFTSPAPAVLNGMAPLNTMADVDAYLTANHVPHDRGTANLDPLTSDPQLVDKFTKLPPGAVFIYGGNGTSYANQLKEAHDAPITGPNALKAAQVLLKRQRTQLAVSRELRQEVTMGASKVMYNPAYAPPAPPKSATPAKPAG
jgi:EpsD family peptidyl-prolyl cis-trans isomerase